MRAIRRKPQTLLAVRGAASVQVATEEVVLRLTRSLARETGMKNLCLAGGVALNCVASGKVLRDRAFAPSVLRAAGLSSPAPGHYVHGA